MTADQPHYKTSEEVDFVIVGSGRGQPILTIEALAFRAADRITALAKRGEISA